MMTSNWGLPSSLLLHSPSLKPPDHAARHRSDPIHGCGDVRRISAHPRHLRDHAERCFGPPPPPLGSPCPATPAAAPTPAAPLKRVSSLGNSSRRCSQTPGTLIYRHPVFDHLGSTCTKGQACLVLLAPHHGTKTHCCATWQRSTNTAKWPVQVSFY